LNIKLQEEIEAPTDPAIHAPERPSPFQLDAFTGSLTVDSGPNFKLTDASLLKNLSHRAPVQPSFAEKFQSMRRADSFESYVKIKALNPNAKVHRFKPPFIPTGTSGFNTAHLRKTTSLSQMLSARKPLIKVQSKPAHIVVNGRPFTPSMIQSSRPIVERRTPRPKKTLKVTEGVDTSQGGWSSKQFFFNPTTDMQERLRQKLKCNSPPKYLGEGEQLSLIDSLSEIESVSQSKMLMSPKYKDSNRLKQTYFTFKSSTKPPDQISEKSPFHSSLKSPSHSSLKSPSHSSLKSPSYSSLKTPKSRRESAAHIGQPLSVRFAVSVMQRPQTSGRLRKGRVLTSPTSTVNVGPKGIHIT
jgi:hypothetical protein